MKESKYYILFYLSYHNRHSILFEANTKNKRLLEILFDILCRCGKGRYSTYNLTKKRSQKNKKCLISNQIQYGVFNTQIKKKILTWDSDKIIKIYEKHGFEGFGFKLIKMN